MAKRNKGASKADRRSYSLKKRDEFQADTDKAYEVLAIFDGSQMLDTHRVLFMCLRSIEEALSAEGVKPPNYVEHRVASVERDLAPDFVWCRRCVFSEVEGEDEMGKWSKCRHPSLGGVLCSHHDGCTFGVKRKEYR